MSVKSIRKAAQLLECFTRHRPAWTLTELSGHLQMHPTTVFRLLSTLQEVGYVVQDSDTRRYRLGLRLLEIGTNVLAGLDLIKEAQPLLHALSDECGESTYLSVLQGDHVVYVATVDSMQVIKTSAHVGERRPLHSTGSGKLFLAYMEPQERARLLRPPLEQRMPSTITDPEVLLRVLEQVRHEGYSISYEEDQQGLVSVAAPVFGPKGLIASLSVAGPAFRLPREALVELSSRVTATARLLSGRMGAPAANFVPVRVTAK